MRVQILAVLKHGPKKLWRSLQVRGPFPCAPKQRGGRDGGGLPILDHKRQPLPCPWVTPTRSTESPWSANAAQLLPHCAGPTPHREAALPVPATEPSHPDPRDASTGIFNQFQSSSLQVTPFFTFLQMIPSTPFHPHHLCWFQPSLEPERILPWTGFSLTSDITSLFCSLFCT